MTLLERVCDFENLLFAFRQCARGKRGSYGYQKLLMNLGEKLLAVRNELQENRYEWGEYREFYIRDPKCRLVSAAPFRDRVVHTAIHNILEPYFEKKMADGVYACRKGRGNRNAVIALLRPDRLYLTDSHSPIPPPPTSLSVPSPSPSPAHTLTYHPDSFINEEVE